MSYALVVVGLGTAAYSIISGVSKNNKAKKMARANKRPNYEIPKAVQDNQRLLESRAGQGLSDNGVQLYRQASDRQTTSTLDAILKGGGTVNNIGELYSSTNDGIAKMALIDEEMRARNVAALVQQNNIIGDHQDKAWQVNTWGPYADKAQAAAALKAQGSKQIESGITTAVSTVANAYTGGMYGSLAGGVFGGKGGGTGGGAGVPGVDSTGAARRINYGGADSTAGAANGAMTPAPIESALLKKELTPAEKIQRQFPGLGAGRRGGMASLDPVWSEDLGSYINPLTGEPL